MGLPGHRQGLLAVTGAAVLWSTGGLFIKWVSLDALALTMWRSLLAGLAMAALTGMRPPHPLRAGWLTWGLALSYAVTLLLFVVATKLTTAANAIFLQYTAPLYLLAIGPFFLDERPSRLDLASVGVAFLGMALFFVGRLEPSDAAGNVAALGSGMAFAAFLILLRQPGCGPTTRPRAIILGNGVLVLAMLAVNLMRRDAAAFTPGPGDAAGLVFLGVLQIGLAYVLFGFGIALVPALEAALIGMLEPVLNPVWVFLVLGERPGWWAVAGGAVIITAVVVRTVASERRRSQLARAGFGVLGVES
ncbi:MAG: DMT family transporter [Dehalococcoidia bacterium]|nr:DMT family transporter [Dehalococcoidia bacterium]